MAAMLLGMLGSLIQAKYICPEDMGAFRTFGILAGYLTFLHLGVLDGLQREIPIQIGRGNKLKAEQAASACLAWISFISLACGALFLALALRAAFNKEWMGFLGWLSYVPVIVMTFYGGYLSTTFRTGHQFVELSRTSIIKAIAETLILPLLPILGYYGMCLRTALGSTANLYYLHKWRPMKVRAILDWSKFREVIRVGLPLSGIGYIATALWASVEATLVLGWFELKVLGLYSVAVLGRTIVSQLAANINQVITVKIFEQYGRTKSVEDCIRLIYRPIILSFLGSIPLVIAGWLLLPHVILLIVPNYLEAVPMAQLMLLMLPITFLRLPSSIPWAMGRWFDCLVPVAVGFIVFTGLAWFLHRLGYGVLSVVLASIIGTLFNISGYFLLIRRLLIQERNSGSKPPSCK